MARIALVAVPPLNITFPSLSVGLLTAEMKMRGHSAKAFDFNVDTFTAADRQGRSFWDFKNGWRWQDREFFKNEIFPKYIEVHFDRWIREILTFNPDWVGFSITENFCSKELAKKIKQAARKLFTEKGFDAVKTRDIAAEAGINLALLNYYFRSKEKLFEIVMPARAYFGKKDFQQLSIIRELVRQKKYPIEIIGCPTIREDNGLAMSSRNERLSPQEREEAGIDHEVDG